MAMLVSSAGTLAWMLTELEPVAIAERKR